MGNRDPVEREQREFALTVGQNQGVVLDKDRLPASFPSGHDMLVFRVERKPDDLSRAMFGHGDRQRIVGVEYTAAILAD